MKAKCTKDGQKYWFYMLLYVYDCLLVHQNSDPVMNDLKTWYKMKGDTLGKLKQYLGVNICRWTLKNRSFWYINPGNYVKEVCKMVKQWIEEEGRKCTKRYQAAMNFKYHPEVNMSEELGDNLVNYFQQVIRILCWVLELWMIDIITKVLLLLLHNCLPHAGHLKIVYQICNYLSHHNNSTQILFDSTLVKLNEDHFP